MAGLITPQNVVRKESARGGATLLMRYLLGLSICRAATLGFEGCVCPAGPAPKARSTLRVTCSTVRSGWGRGSCRHEAVSSQTQVVVPVEKTPAPLVAV